MALFKKVRKNGVDVELPASGLELRKEMEKAAQKEEFKNRSGELLQGNSSVLVRSVFSDLGLTWEEAKRALNPTVLQNEVRELFVNTNLKPLFPIITEDYIRGGYEKAGHASELIAGTVPIDQQTSEFYYWDDDKKEEQKAKELGLKTIAQGAPIPTLTIKLNDKKTIRVYKRGAGIELTDEAKSMTIDMLALFLKRQGAYLGRADEALAIDRLVNGYFAGDWDKPTEIGVKNTGNITLSDMWYATQFMEQETGFTPKRAIMNLATSEKWVSNVVGNVPVFLEQLKNGMLPNVINSQPFISNKIPDGKVLFVDTDYALQEYVYKAFSTENERNVKTQIEGTYSTKTSDYVTFEKSARLLVDLSKSRT